MPTFISPPCVWIVDDDPSIRWVLEKTLTAEAISWRSFSDVAQAQSQLNHETPAIVVSDVRMPNHNGLNGLDWLVQLKQQHPNMPVIIMTAFSDLDTAVAAFQQGAYEYLPKPFDIDAAVVIVKRALAEHLKLKTVPAALPFSLSGTVPTPFTLSHELLGQAPAMQALFRSIGKLARSSATVLITGESGTGKERVAQALHHHSVRKHQPFIALNTAAIPKDLLESELFGHERGSFTGAATLRKGRFEQAHGGTLFLDEIGDMPAELQTRLLRVLAQGQFYRVGGTMAITANVRVIAATHQDLEARVAAGLFREDLFHRLNVIHLRLPALRERPEDIALLAQYFLHQAAIKLGVTAKQLLPNALQALQQGAWQGNVRQLENMCEWLTVMTTSGQISLEDLPPELQQAQQQADISKQLNQTPQVSQVPQVAQVPAWHQAVYQETLQRLQAGETNFIESLSQQLETMCIQAALAYTQGNKSDAAKQLGLGRNTLARKVKASK